MLGVGGLGVCGQGGWQQGLWWVWQRGGRGVGVWWVCAVEGGCRWGGVVVAGVGRVWWDVVGVVGGVLVGAWWVVGVWCGMVTRTQIYIYIHIYIPQEDLPDAQQLVQDL